MSEQFSPIAQNMLGVIVSSTMPPKGSYIAGWTICDKLGVDRGQLDCRIPGTQYDDALKELIDAGVVEKHPKLGCRYRLCQKQTEQLHTSCPQRVLDMLDSPEYDLYQEVEGDQEILQRLGTHFRYFDDLLTDIG